MPLAQKQTMKCGEMEMIEGEGHGKEDALG